MINYSRIFNNLSLGSLNPTENEYNFTCRFVHAFPGDGHAEYHGDGRGEVCRDGLDVDEELTALHLLDQRDPQDADHHQAKDRYSSK